MALERLSTRAEAFTVTVNLPSRQTDMLGDFEASLEVTNFSGTSVVVTIEMSPDPEEILDANAIWYTLLTFATATGNTTERVTNTTRHFSRLRTRLVVVSANGNVSVIIEGEQVNLSEGNL